MVLWASLVASVLAANVLAIAAHGESTNYAATLDWPGYIDSDLSFAESNWFASSHTIMARFMPQYPRAYSGPIVTVNDGSGTFELGVGHYREGLTATKLVLRVGGTVTYYYVSLPAGVWQHLALVRRNAVYNGFQVTTFEMYLNGQKRCAGMTVMGPCTDSIRFIGPGPQAPAGNIRIGRGIATRSGVQQFYGLIDDIAVFSKALDPATISALAAKNRLDGTESGLLRGWTFDNFDPGGYPLPAALNHPLQLQAGASRTVVSKNRDDADSAALPLPHLFFAPVMKLPFIAKQQWRIIQGYASDESHNGSGAFSLDFGLVGPQSPNKVPNPYNPGDPSCGEPIYASAAGKLVWTHDSGGADEGDVPNNDYDGNNLATVEQDAFSYATYMHTFTGSIYASFHDLLPPLGSSIPIPSGKQIATVGTRNSCHLHFGVGNSTGDKDLDPIFGSPDLPYVNYPVAFWNYEACDKQNGKDCTDPANWYFVGYGVPVEGQFVRNP